MYKKVWDAAIGQVLPCYQERGNIHDPYAVAVVERGVIVGIDNIYVVGHVP